MPVTKQSLLQALEELKHALADNAAGQGKGWAWRVSPALDALEQSIRHHRAILRDAEGRVVDVDTPLSPSPGVDRRADKLHQELNRLLAQIHTLREQWNAVRPSKGIADPFTAAGALPVAPEVGERTDFAVFYEQAEQFLNELRHYNEEEAMLIEDNITLDLGAGD